MVGSPFVPSLLLAEMLTLFTTGMRPILEPSSVCRTLCRRPGRTDVLRGGVILLLLHLSLQSTGAAGADSRTKGRLIDFEDVSGRNWTAFIPSESASAGCSAVRDASLSHSGAASVRLTSEAPARYGVRPRNLVFSVRPGERYRLSAWVRRSARFVPAEGTPGVVARFTLLDATREDSAAGHLFAALDGSISSDIGSIPAVHIPVDEWVQLIGEISVPDGCAEIVPIIFVWCGHGTLWVDDIGFEQLADAD